MSRATMFLASFGGFRALLGGLVRALALSLSQGAAAGTLQFP
jgi:hypothetical protein